MQAAYLGSSFADLDQRSAKTASLITTIAKGTHPRSFG
jgi:hypothetical protein